MQYDERRCSANAVLGDKMSSNTDAVGGINVIDAVRDQSDRGWSSQILKSKVVQIFQSTEAIIVRDFDDRGIILIQVGYFLFLELLEQQHLREVLHAEHSKGSGLGSS